MMSEPAALLDVLRLAYLAHAPDRLARFPETSEPGTPGTEIDERIQTGSRIPAVPGQKQDGSALDVNRGAGEWEERAAILEYDGGLGRAEAERLASEELSPP